MKDSYHKSQNKLYMKDDYNTSNIIKTKKASS